MLYHPKKGHVVVIGEEGRKRRYARVVEVSNFWGWYKVRYLNGFEKIFQLSSKGTYCAKQLTVEEEADLYRRLENAGITDCWQD